MQARGVLADGIFSRTPVMDVGGDEGRGAELWEFGLPGEGSVGTDGRDGRDSDDVVGPLGARGSVARSSKRARDARSRREALPWLTSRSVARSDRELEERVGQGMEKKECNVSNRQKNSARTEGRCGRAELEASEDLHGRHRLPLQRERREAGMRRDGRRESNSKRIGKVRRTPPYEDRPARRRCPAGCR